MVDLEQLAGRAQRVARRSRARMAVRIAVPIAVAALVVIATGAHVTGCAAIAVVLLAVSAYARWWSREGVRAVRLGLAMGAVPLIASLLLPPCGAQCVPLGDWGEVDLVCVTAGAVAGIGLAALADRDRHAWRPWGLALLVALLVAMLGCVSFGVSTLLATLVPLVAASASVQLPLGIRAGSRP